jgi:hypothetical protein
MTMPRTRLSDFVPDMYRAIVPELFEAPVGEEKNATCDRCAMCAPADPTFPPHEYFNPDTKCCTYHPVLPNYAVGGLLHDRSAAGAEGRRRIQTAIARRVGVTPLALLPPAKQDFLQRHGKAGFGRSNALRCPYLDAEHQRCSIWSHREAVCTTWFCKHNHGQAGLLFWQQLRDYLLETQWLLSLHALRALGLDVDRIDASQVSESELDARALDDTPLDDESYAALWHDWAGREEELYSAAYEVTRALDRASFEQLGGIRLRLALERLDKRYRDMREPAVAEMLLKNPALRVTRTRDGSYIVVGYVGTDPLRVKKTLYDLLDDFDGRRSNAEVRSAILARGGDWISDSLLVKLYQHRILIAASERTKRRLPTT